MKRLDCQALGENSAPMTRSIWKRMPRNLWILLEVHAKKGALVFLPTHPPGCLNIAQTPTNAMEGILGLKKKKKHANLQSIPSLFANFTHILRNPSQRIQADRPIPCPARVRTALGTDRSWRSEKEAPGLPHLE